MNQKTKQEKCPGFKISLCQISILTILIWKWEESEYLSISHTHSKEMKGLVKRVDNSKANIN